MKQPLVFFADGPLTPAEFLAEDFPLLQTQALLISLDELEAWIDEAKKHLGPAHLSEMHQGLPPRPCLEGHRDWLNMAQNYVLDMRDAVEEDEDGGELLKCRLTADDPLIEALETVLDNCPSEDEIRESYQDVALAETLISLTGFWIERICQLLKRLLSLAMGDGETLAILNRQKVLAELSF
jgi:hypothetical protein